MTQNTRTTVTLWLNTHEQAQHHDTKHKINGKTIIKTQEQRQHHESQQKNNGNIITKNKGTTNTAWLKTQEQHD